MFDRLRRQLGLGIFASMVVMAVAPQDACVSRSDAAESQWWRGAEQTSSGPTVELARNPGFEAGGSRLPQEWVRDSSTEGKGEAQRDDSRSHTGRASLRLDPNTRNTGQTLLAISQVIPAASYRGDQVEYSVFINSEGGARAALGMLAIVGGRVRDIAFSEPVINSDWSRRAATYNVPDDPSVQLVVFCIIDGPDGTAWFDDVSVMPVRTAGPGSETPDEASGPLSADVVVDADQVIREIPRALFGANIEWRWNATSLWKESEDRLDPEGVRLAQELGVTLIRYPGGIYSDYYHWRDGIGPRSQRPIVKHEPGKADESRPNFGTDEALDFADRIGAELLITVNAGTGTAREAADWVRYVNAKRLRVRYWEIGNELYFRSGTELSRVVTVKPAVYAARVREFARAMTAADPRIEIGVIGGENQGAYRPVDYRDWNKTVFEQAGEYIGFLSVHNAYGPILTGDEDGRTLRDIYRAMLARPVHIAANLRVLSDQLALYYPDPLERPFIAVTEWGPIFQFFHAGQYVDHPKTLGSALFVASTLKAFLESPDTDMAAFWMLNDFSVLGWISSRNSDFPPAPEWMPTARYYAFQMFSRYFGSRLVRSTATGPTFRTRRIGWSEATPAAPYVEVVSSLGTGGEELYVMVINKHFDRPVETDIQIRGFEPAPTATVRTLTGTGIDANTGTQVIRVPGLTWGVQMEDPVHQRFHSGGPGEVTLTTALIDGVSARITYSFPPHSITTLVLTRQQ